MRVLVLVLLALMPPLSQRAFAAPENTTSRIAQECLNQWAGNPEQMNYCIREQVKDFTSVTRSSASPQVKSYCKSQYGADYSMVKACIQNAGIVPIPTGDIGRPATGSSASRPVPASVNGVWINICSHGALCHGAFVDAVRMGR
jgi:hypothetical protein